jgi:hypothetical protein
VPTSILAFFFIFFFCAFSFVLVIGFIFAFAFILLLFLLLLLFFFCFCFTALCFQNLWHTRIIPGVLLNIAVCVDERNSASEDKVVISTATHRYLP